MSQKPEDTENNQLDQGQIPDLALLDAVRKGDRLAYQTLVERYLSRLWRLAVSVLHDEAEAEDVVQDVFLTIWKNREAWSTDGPAKFSTWIYRVTMNRCIDVKRRRKNTTDSDDLSEILANEDEKGADQSMVDAQERGKLLSLMADLPENQRMALILYYFDELSVEEISDRLATTEQGARSLLKRGRKSLREKLEHDDQNHDHSGVTGTP